MTGVVLGTIIRCWYVYKENTDIIKATVRLLHLRNMIVPLYSVKGWQALGNRDGMDISMNEERSVFPCNTDKLVLFSKAGQPYVKMGKWGVIDIQGKEYIPCVYDDMQSAYENGYIGVQKNGLWGFADSTGRIVIMPQYKK